ncbi:hypothetical protein V1477_001411 [Vespula maculifrons]|uniref:Uncharacterized protein n=1 Tax=Vespula maculifrons TaxID=7453 RepID=A0ABD2CYZ6_VESMC
MALFYKVWNGGTRKWDGFTFFKGSKPTVLRSICRRSTQGQDQIGIEMKLREGRSKDSPFLEVITLTGKYF